MPPVNTIVSTGFILPQAVIDTGVVGASFQNPNNILQPDDQYAQSAVAGVSDITVGNFNFNIPANAIITGIEFQVKGLRGALTVPAQTLTFYAIDNTSGTDVEYPYISPFSGLTPTNTLYVFGTDTYQFASSFTPDQANNLKLRIVANGDVSIDVVLMNVFYYIPSSSTVLPDVGDNCDSCNSPIQVQAMFLQLPFLVNETKFYLKKGSLTYPDGTPVQPGDVGECGGEVVFVFDEGKKLGTGNSGDGFEENVVVDVETGTWTVLSDGVIEVDIGAVTNRGLDFKTPYDHDASRMSNHAANSKVIISNSGRFYSRFVRRCEAGNTFSEPIAVQQNDVDVVNPATKLNFQGAVSVTQDPGDDEKANIYIAGTGSFPPIVVDAVSGTSGGTQVLDLVLPDLDITGINRGVLYQIATEEAVSVVSVIGNGVELFTQEAVETDVVNNIRTEQWFLLAPTAGPMSIEVTLSAPAYISHGAEALTGVDQVTPIGSTSNDSGTSTTPSTTNLTIYDNSAIFDSLATALLPILFTKGLNQVLNWDEFSSPTERQGASSYQLAGAAPDSVIMSWSMTQNTDWCMTSVEVKGLTVTAPPPSGVTLEDETGGVSIPNVTNIQVPDTHLESPAVGQGVIKFQNVLETVNQVGHGFSVGDVVQSSGTDGEYTLSQADNAANSEVSGIVSQVIDADNFVVVMEGLVALSSGIPGGAVAGDILYLDDAVAGALTLTAPSAAGTIVHKLAQVIDDANNIIYFHNYLGLTQNQVNPTSGNTTVNITSIDDFTNTLQVSSDGTSTYQQSGNFYAVNDSGADPAALPNFFTEPDHPGIVRLDAAGNAAMLIGFAQTGNSVPGGAGLLNFDNDFDVEVLARLTYAGTWTMRWEFSGGTDTISIQISNTFVSYNIGGGVVNTAVPVPASGTWFKLRFLYVSGTLTLSLDASTIFNGATALTDEFQMTFTPTTIGGGSSLDADIDYVSTNYTVTR